jgi:hypothetical protein
VPSRYFFLNLLELHGIDCSQDGAYADVVVKLGLIKLLQKRFDLCEEAYVVSVFTLSSFYSHLLKGQGQHNSTVPCCPWHIHSRADSVAPERNPKRYADLFVFPASLSHLDKPNLKSLSEDILRRRKTCSA